MTVQRPGALYPLPDWIPLAPRSQSIKLALKSDNLEDWNIVKRLSIDPRMKTVWAELNRRNRSDRKYMHVADSFRDNDENMDPLVRHEEALGYIFFFVFSAARDKIQASKFEDGTAVRDLAELRLNVLNELVDDLNGAVSAEELAALRSVAGYQEQILAALRPSYDPLTIQNDRGDRTERGVQIVIAAALQDTFGKLLHRTSATLTTVALGLPRPASERVTRSAFSKLKQP